MNEYRATLSRVTDGDTVWLDVDLGFRAHQFLEFRLAHIDCKSIATPEGAAATQFVADWFTETAGLCIIQTSIGAKGADKQEKWGRWLAVIRASADTPTLNDILVQRGMAVPYEGGKK